MAKKKQSKAALSASQRWLAKARQSLSQCAHNFVVYAEDGETVLWGPSTVYACQNWLNSQPVDLGAIISQDFRDEDEKAAQEDRCEDCDPFKYGHPCRCRSKTISKAWR